MRHISESMRELSVTDAEGGSEEGLEEEVPSTVGASDCPAELWKGRNEHQRGRRHHANHHQ